MKDRCYECDLPHEHGEPHMYRVACPDGRPGCATAHYSAQKPDSLATLERAVIDAAVEARRMRTAGAMAYLNAMERLDTAVDALLAARGKP